MVFGRKNPTPSLAKETVRSLVDNYSDADITTELQRVAGIMLEETRTRLNQLDTKANGIVGFAGVVLALLVNVATRLPADSNTVGVKTSLAISGAFALLAGILGSVASWVRKVAWLPDRAWFDEAALKRDADPNRIKGEPAEALRRQFLIQAHAVVIDHDQANKRKARWILCGQICLVLSAAALLVALLFAVWPQKGTRSPNEPKITYAFCART